MTGHEGRMMQWVVAFSADHQLPRDAGHLVGQRHRRHLRRLALEKLDQPGRAISSASLYLLNHSSCTYDQHAAQRLVAGARDAAKSLFVRRRVILRSEADPSRKIPAG